MNNNDNSFDSRPVFEYDQVLTCNDLESLAKGFLYQYRYMNKWYNWYERFKLKVAIGTITTIHLWIHSGKKTETKEGFIK